MKNQGNFILFQNTSLSDLKLAQYSKCHVHKIETYQILAREVPLDYHKKTMFGTWNLGSPFASIN
jgi:hypothetical protein